MGGLLFMKKFLRLLLATTLIFTLTACGNNGEPQNGTDDNDDNRVIAKSYVIGTDTTFAPFEFQDAGGNQIGIDMDLLSAIAEDQGFEYTVEAMGFDAAVQALESKQVDGVIAGMSITDKRKESFDFSDPYFDSGVVMGISADNDEVTSYVDLTGQKVAVKQGTEGATFAESIQEKYDFELIVFPESALMYEDVKIGNTIACFEDYPVLGYAISQNVGLKIVTEKEQGSSYGFAVPKGENPELLNMFNQGFANVVESGKYQEILDTYISE